MPRTPASQETPPTPSPNPLIDPNATLVALRQKADSIINDFTSGAINRAQFEAIYARYSEQRTIIERMLTRNPESDAWRQVVNNSGHTGFLIRHYAAQTLYYAVICPPQERPVLTSTPPISNDIAAVIAALVRRVWGAPSRPMSGLGRKPLSEQRWLILATGRYAATAVVWSSEPAIAQAQLVRDLHDDFERANASSLARGWVTNDELVFPQRSLNDQS